MRVGFTGTRRGIVPAQLAALTLVLAELEVTEFHHGSCVGADVQAADLLHVMRSDAALHVYPSNIATARAACLGDVMHYPDDPLVRNRRIVDAVDVLVATPGEAVERQRSGTWATVRYARRAGRPVTVVYPNGTIVRTP